MYSRNGKVKLFIQIIYFCARQGGRIKIPERNSCIGIDAEIWKNKQVQTASYASSDTAAF